MIKVLQIELKNFNNGLVIHKNASLPKFLVQGHFHFFFLFFNIGMRILFSVITLSSWKPN